jgi:hypothetical protein
VTRAWLAALPLALGCAVDAGHGFATVETATLEARFEPGPARAVDGGFVTDRGYTVRLEALALETEELALESLSAARGGGSFDPARPPPGYTLCHGGHCHAEDGSLVSYAEVEAELSGGGGFVRVVTFGGAHTLDLLAPQTRALEEGSPSRELPRTTVRRAVLRVQSFELRGEVSAEGSVPRGLVVTLAGGIAIEAPFELVIDEQGLGALELHAALLLDGTLFDGVDFTALGDGDLQSTSAEDVLGAGALTALARAEISIEVRKR